MAKKKTLYAGPWVGELGWELFCWQGFLRKMAPRFDDVVVACRTGHELLYRDFTSAIINYDPAGEETDMWSNRREPNHRNFFQYYLQGSDAENGTVITHDSFRSRWWMDVKQRERQEFKLLAEPVDSIGGFDILMIVRDTQKCNTGFRNWPIPHATHFAHEMKKKGLSVACVGKTESAECVAGAEDCRDIPLDRLARIMAKSRVIVGPQCGPSHLGALCLLPQVSWQTCQEHAIRTTTHWNPFNVPMETLPSDDRYWKQRVPWVPLIGDVENATERILNREITQ